jgi:hypothetical protein
MPSADEPFTLIIFGAETVDTSARLKVPSEGVWERFAAAVHYVAGDPADPALCAKLGAKLGELERGRSREPRRLRPRAPGARRVHAPRRREAVRP